MTDAYIIVKGTPSDGDDAGVPGAYLVQVRDEAPREFIEESALEVFHLKVGIATLDDFSIEVLDETGNRFPGQSDDPDVRDNHPLERWADFQGAIDDSDLPFTLSQQPAP